MVPGRKLLFVNIFIRQEFDELVVFGVDRDECADRFAMIKHFVKHSVRNTEIVYHEYLETRHAHLYGVFHCVKQLAFYIFYS